MSIIKGENLANIPWESRPSDCNDIIWRYSGNPVIKHNAIPTANSIFNSAIVPYKGEFRGVFRIDDKTRVQRLHSAKSKDGINWDISHEPISFIPENETVPTFISGYDPRVCWIEDRYYVSWCNEYHGPTIGLAYTYDFETYYQLENAFMPFNRNGVLFPKKINNRFAMITRPSDNTHTMYGDIFYSESPDMEFWGRHRHVMAPIMPWEKTKIGGGPTPIETTEGWLVFYHGVLYSCSGFVYSFGAALLDLEQPWNVLHRADSYLMHPETPYERMGDVPNVVFPCAALTDAQSGRIAIYYGAADTVVGLAFTEVDMVVDYIKKHDLT